MIRVGPARMIVLKSGKYDLAEIALDGPIHLVGPNNVGKTSLIALLQFLYLDDQKAMHFCRDLQETRRYYFPDPESYVIFECLTPTGFQTLVVHGLGPLHGFEFERFAYQGRFDRDDYIDAERRVRPAEDICARLASRSFVKLEPKHLRAALTGVGDSKDLHLGLVPLRNRGHYSRFRSIFRNLLRLAHLRQEELKTLLLDVFEGDFRQRKISLNRSYAQTLERIRRDASEVRELKTLRAEIEKLVEHHAKREACRARLPALWRALGASVEARRRAQDKIRSDLTGAIGDVETELSVVQERQHVAQKTLTELSGRMAVIAKQLDDLSREAAAFQDFVPEWAQNRKVELEAELRNLAARMAGGEAEPPARVQDRIRRREKDAKAQRERLVSVESAAGTLLRKRGDDDAIRDAFRILNPDLLGLPVNTDRPGINVSDASTAEETVSALASSCGDGRFVHNRIVVDLGALEAPDLERFTDPARMRTELESLDAELARDRASLEAARQMAALREQESASRAEHDRLVQRLYAHNAYVERRGLEPKWRGEAAHLDAARATCAEEIETLAKNRDGLNARRREITDGLRANDLERANLDQRVRTLRAPDPAWPLVETVGLPSELDDIMDRYGRAQDEETKHAERFGELMGLIESKTYGRYADPDETVVVARLNEQIECLPEKEKAVQDLWTSVAVDLKKAFKDLGADVDALKSGVDDLNRRLAKVSISNLARLRLLVEERPEWVARIRSVTQAEEMPLFADFGASQKAMEDLGRLLSTHPEVKLDELFDLHFDVTTPDGRERRYPHLDAIESNGTTITIKVLINLMMLRGLLDDTAIQLPFYIDEASSLDRENLRAIVREAEGMGFVAVLASPDAMDVARTVYFIEELPNGRVVLDPETAKVELLESGEPAK